MSSLADTPIDLVREYWNDRPCNVRHSTAEIGTREYFDDVEWRKYFVEPHIPKLAEFEKWRGKKVLEIGCGIGTDTMNFARAGADVTAVDLSRESLNLAIKRSKVFGLTERIKFYEGNAENLSEVIPLQKYDLVYSFGVIHHSPQPEKIVEQIRAHFLNPGGTLKLMVYYRYSWKVFWILMTYGKGRFWGLNKLIATHSEAQTGCPVTYTYSRQTLHRLLEPGFEAKNMWVDHIFPYRIPDYVKYEYVKQWYFRYLGTRLFHWLERQIGWHLCVTASAK